jgi:hypothetical protein
MPPCTRRLQPHRWAEFFLKLFDEREQVLPVQFVADQSGDVGAHVAVTDGPQPLYEVVGEDDRYLRHRFHATQVPIRQTTCNFADFRCLTNDANAILNETATDLVMNVKRGQVIAIDSAGEPEIANILSSIENEELSGG